MLVFSQHLFSIPFWFFLLTIFLVWGINLIFWSLVGLVRFILESLKITPDLKAEAVVNSPLPGKVAILIPAHNEELVIAETLASLRPLGPVWNVFVVSDNSSDRTAEIAREFGVNVLELNPGKGKAGALEEALKHFNILSRFDAAMFVDADSRIASDYLIKALPFLGDPCVAAVAGYARTIWQPKKLSWPQRLFVLHRERIYFFSQLLMKFGQTWRHINVTPIAPGFASLYKTRALSKINLNPQGLVIEDFNMTFETHHKGLGLIMHNPGVSAYTQDPDNLKDYFRQVKRWQLGLWQTVRLHGVWLGKFWAALAPMLLEIFVVSFLFLLLPFALGFWLALAAMPAMIESVSALRQFALFPLPLMVLLAIILPDYLMSVFAAVAQRRPEYLLAGLGFPFLRFFDALAFLGAMPKAFFIKSTGRWVSPVRRVI